MLKTSVTGKPHRVDRYHDVAHLKAKTRRRQVVGNAVHTQTAVRSPLWCRNPKSRGDLQGRSEMAAALSFEDQAIDWNFFPRSNSEAIAKRDLIERDIAFIPIVGVRGGVSASASETIHTASIVIPATIEPHFPEATMKLSPWRFTTRE